jgi:hypothetical protein
MNPIQQYLSAIHREDFAAPELRKTLSIMENNLESMAEYGEDYKIFQNPKASQKAIKAMLKLIREIG